MAELAAAPVSKDRLLEALSKKEGAATSSSSRPPKPKRAAAVSADEAGDSLEEFLNAPDSSGNESWSARQELERVRRSRLQHSADRVQQLKASMDAVTRQVQSSNEARRKRQQKVRDEQEARKRQLLEEGLNPYEVFRREEMEADKEAQKAKLKALNEYRSEKLLEQLMTEEAAYKKRQAAEKQKRLEAEEFQRQMGNYAKEQKTAAYIRKMTIGNVDVLDPTGTALRIDPSKVCVQKTHAFGLGRAPPSEIDKVERDLMRSTRSLTSRLPPKRADSDGQLGGGPSSDGEAAAELAGSSYHEDGQEAPTEKKLWVPKLSKLEEQYLAAARERQKERLQQQKEAIAREKEAKAALARKPSPQRTLDTGLGRSAPDAAQDRTRSLNSTANAVPPIYVEQEEYDLGTCVFGQMFRENVVVRNRQQAAIKIEVKRPKQIEGELLVNPTVAYIQGEREFPIQVKFSPKVDFLDKNPQYRDTERRGVPGAFRIPVKIVSAEQESPVLSALVGTVTGNDIRFEPAHINFGRCFVGSSATARLSVVNESLLPQQYSFTRLPPLLQVRAVPADVIEEEKEDPKGPECMVLEGGGDGTSGSLMPGERRQLYMTYTPESAIELYAKLPFKAVTGGLGGREFTREFAMECRGQGVMPLLSLSQNNINLAPIPLGVSSKENIIVTNVGKAPYTVNLMLPPAEQCGLKASPACCTISPGQSQRVQLEFRPTEAYGQFLRPPDPPPEPPEGGEEGEEGHTLAPSGSLASLRAAEPADDAEPKVDPYEEELQKYRERLALVRDSGGRRWEDSEAVRATWRLAISHRPEGGGKESRRETQILYFRVSTCLLPKILTATPAVLDFGEVTAQERKTLSVTLDLAPGTEPQDLRMEPLPDNQCFTVLNPTGTIAGKPFQLMIDFHPQQVWIYQTVLQLHTQSTRVQVPLRGRGVRPVLKIEPADGVIRMGSVTFGREGKDYTTEKLEIKNDSPYELCYSLETVLPADPNHTGPPPFTLTPSTGVVEANGRKTVTVTFRPHRPLAVFREKVLVNVPNQKEPTYVYLYGHCFKYQTYALPGMEFNHFTEEQAKGHPVFLDSLSVGLGSGANAATGEFQYPKAQQTEFSLKFGEGERTQYLLLGASVPPGYPAAPQNTPPPMFEFQILQSEFSKYFTVEAPEGSKPDKMAKGPVVAGKHPIKVAFKYSPEEKTSLQYGDVSLDLLSGIGQWITCKVKGILSGGFVPAGEPPTQEISIELRAYLQQI